MNWGQKIEILFLEEKKKDERTHKKKKKMNRLHLTQPWTDCGDIKNKFG